MTDTENSRINDLVRRLNEIEGKLSQIASRQTGIELLEYKVNGVLHDLKEVRLDLRKLEADTEHDFREVHTAMDNRSTSLDAREKERSNKELTTLKTIIAFLITSVISMGVYIWQIVLTGGSGLNR